MRKTLCSILILTTFISSLAGCMTEPVKPKTVGPKIYGYTLNQKLTNEQLQQFTKSDKKFINMVTLYQQPYLSGGVLGLYVDSKLWLNTLTHTSQTFSSMSDCQAAQKAEQTQLDILIEEFNNRHKNPTDPLYQPESVYARQAVDECQRITEKDQEIEVFRYTLWTTLQAANLKPGQAFPKQIEQTHAPAWNIAFVVVSMTILMVAWVMAGDGNGDYCNNEPQAQRKDYCKK